MTICQRLGGISIVDTFGMCTERGGDRAKIETCNFLTVEGPRDDCVNDCKQRDIRLLAERESKAKGPMRRQITRQHVGKSF